MVFFAHNPVACSIEHVQRNCTIDVTSFLARSRAAASRSNNKSQPVNDVCNCSLLATQSSAL